MRGRTSRLKLAGASQPELLGFPASLRSGCIGSLPPSPCGVQRAAGLRPAKLAQLVLLQGNGDVMQMLRSDLEPVDIGEGRVLILPDLQPSELTLDDVCVLTLEDAEKF